MPRSELEKLKDRYRQYSDVSPRIMYIRLIVALDLAYKYIEEAQKCSNSPKQDS